MEASGTLLHRSDFHLVSMAHPVGRYESLLWTLDWISGVGGVLMVWQSFLPGAHSQLSAECTYRPRDLKKRKERQSLRSNLSIRSIRSLRGSEQEGGSNEFHFFCTLLSLASWDPRASCHQLPSGCQPSSSPVQLLLISSRPF